MRVILRLVARDVRHATRNVMACIVIFGLVVIPSLFTWFNVIASWDPFANTSNLKVAVASTDTGYESDLVPLRIDVGEQVLSALRANDDLDWVVTTEDDAIDGTKSGAYYAAIVLPPSFSSDMMTFYVDGAQHSDIALYTNEKKNALAPKITGQGADGVSAQISETFTQTLSEIALGLLSSLSDYLTDDDTQAALARLQARVSGLSTQLHAGAQTADMFSALFDSSIPLVNSASQLVDAAGGAFNDAAGAAGSGRDAVDSVASALRNATGGVSDALSATTKSYNAVGDRIDDLYADIDRLNGDRVTVLTDIAARVQDQIDRYNTIRDTLDTEVRPTLPAAAEGALDTVIAVLDDAIARQQAVHDRLAEAATDVQGDNASAQDSHQEILVAIAEAKTAVRKAQSAYTDDLKPQLDLLSSTLSRLDSDVSVVRSDLAGVSASLSGSADSVLTAIDRGKTVASGISTSLDELADRFGDLDQALGTAADTGDLSELRDIIGGDPGVLAASLAEPVRVDRTAVFPVAGFGAAMAPLYTILALWVGALLMTVTIRVDVNHNTLPGAPALTTTQKYLGRYGIFGLVGLAQSTLLTLGLILFVRIEPAHPLLMVLAGWLTSLVFTLIVYTAVVTFGNAGKALCVLLLVIQISGSGGAYPLQLLPDWFQNISPFLPATYAIQAMRSAIAGVYAADFWISLLLLALFIVPALLLGLVLRRPLIAYNRGMSEALESTKLM
ncbi:YhgE/Pip domain-containing protein [Microbacterium binotii]|uniref:YhgE/Pip domain-containing protein n=1 Tax=Microbacterium binotii TaxID=462710 RepID=A0ABN3P9G8_9MICO